MSSASSLSSISSPSSSSSSSVHHPHRPPPPPPPSLSAATSSSMTVILSARAYAKAVMHAIKHPTSIVNGIFVGQIIEAVEEEAEEEEEDKVKNHKEEGDDDSSFDKNRRRILKDGDDERNKEKEVERKEELKQRLGSNSRDNNSSNGDIDDSEEEDKNKKHRETNQIFCISKDRKDDSPDATTASSLNNKTKTKGSVLLVEDAIPLFHVHILSPMMTLGFELIEKCVRLSDDRNRQIVGFYHADAEPFDFQAERRGDSEETTSRSFSVSCRTTGDRIAEMFGAAVMCLIDASYLEASEGIQPMENLPVINPMGCARIFMKGEGQWKAVPPERIITTDETKQLSEIVISNGTYLSIVDFDDHLFSSELSPLNLKLFMDYESFLKKDEKKYWEELRRRRGIVSLNFSATHS